MKVRLEYGESFGEVNWLLHGTEPQWNRYQFRWVSRYQPTEICRRFVKDYFKPVPGPDQLNEYDLSRKKPRFVCTWEPI